MTLRMRKEDWIYELMDLAAGKSCLLLKVCMYVWHLLYLFIYYIQVTLVDDTISGE